ncbi:MAG: glutamate-5-semialdehyde dehydrogenase [Clostridium sp.]|jgi:glutamate-5-semialdehyde dehydrogenase|uniref:glutamate-5-semialdehyde dehydrogenase n=1 Tax=Clostridium sp. TaxID=1506 RepID=UPI0025C4EF8F|nr:glutamate-5-semialdehyde dehydrogenase [Clostridium sp.]MCH3964376.1 glutamate-5-semialdehyde dehydrogenase [Clostridium sp.]MCI1715551.1 glutamate-5-semialdehyde dehydrogenase [Clostridium sp.]MCI1799657.1 glutamate-5-semialdehyde dehydrogenase [Clostridium sp.]MCI1813735.1 glutamate-5-semialdehyde dehydrogenase [Clostridium sp.]MCI1870470.1 glutamate-5-semialdehyde dehydrogenase [Clostridium sp.]
MDIKGYIMEKAGFAKEASKKLSYEKTEVKNRALVNMSEAVLKNKDYIMHENEKDVENARKKGISRALIDRLMLDDRRIEDMAGTLKDTAALPDPVGEVIRMWKRPNGLNIGKMKVPLGVIGIIYEARPNVTVDAAALCIKSGNAVILKGGSEAINSNAAIYDVISRACYEAGVAEGAIQFIDIAERQCVNIMMKLNEYIDVLIPRGGAGLIKNVVKNSTVPVIETGLGNCHVYVDESADFKMAEEIIVNAKTQRPGVCNAMETLLVNGNIAESFLPHLCKVLKNLGVEIRGCDITRKIVEGVVPASEEDWWTEYLDLILAVKVVPNINEAIEHIYKYGTGHSEVIVTNNYANSQKFLKEIDAAAVYVNASSRFTDGGQFGFGGEIGISTQKLHARGPMGVNELTTSKYIIYGSGQIRK